MTSSVDLAAGTEGVITFRSGEQFWCPIVKHDSRHPDLFLVRYEHGWYARFYRDGTQSRAGVVVHGDGSTEDVVNHQRDIVAFEPCSSRAGLPGEVSP